LGFIPRTHRAETMDVPRFDITIMDMGAGCGSFSVEASQPANSQSSFHMR
jgi:predicted RNA methylase